ncbi:MAG: oligosaccharide flippase family protein [Eubacteriales bacterium]|nr:oligosaccharide flippase family protein [Eubacteriales bacterium]
MSKSNRELKWGSALSYAQMVISIIIGIAYTPVMIRLLGQNEYGLYSTISSTIAMLSVLSLGFNSSYVRFYSRYKQRGDTEGIFRLNGLFLMVFLVIGFIAFICGMFLTTHLRLVFKEGLTAQEYETARVLMILFTIDLSVSFPASVFSTIISANERFVFLKVLGMVKTVVAPLVNLPLLLLGFRSIGLVTSTLVFGLMTDIVYIHYVTARLKNRFYFSEIEAGLFRSIFTFTIFIAINTIVDQINVGIDNVLLGRYRGTAEVAVYAVGATLHTHYKRISTAISGVFTPRIHRMYNKYSDPKVRNREITKLFIKVGRVQFLILMLVASGMIIFGQEFIRFWVGKGYEKSYYVALLLIIPASVPLIQNLGIEIQRAYNKHQFRSIVYLIMAILNLIMTVFLSQLFGAVGAAFGTAVSIAVANGLLMNIYYYKGMGLNIPLFWRNILRLMLGMLPAFAVGTVIKIFIRFSSVWSMLGFIVLYSCTYLICIWFFSINEFEKELLISPVSKVIGKWRKV